MLVILSLSHVCDAENESEKHAKSSNHNVANRQEVVLATESVRRGQNEIFLSLEWSNLELIINLNLVLSSLEATVNSSPQLAEVWKTSSSHPDDEVF